MRDFIGLGLPVRHVSAQGFKHALSIAPRLDRQHFDALRNQHGGFALHLGAVLQVFNRLDAFGQLPFHAGQRLFGQRRTGFGGIALPGQRIGQIELGQGQQSTGFFGPLGGGGFLAFAALDFVELFFQWLGSAFVAIGQVFIDLGHLLGRGLGGQPLADARGALAGRGGRKSAARQAVQRMGLGTLGRTGFHGNSRRSIGFGRFGQKRAQHIDQSFLEKAAKDSTNTVAARP